MTPHYLEPTKTALVTTLAVPQVVVVLVARSARVTG